MRDYESKLNSHYMNEQSVLEEVLETHKLMPVKNKVNGEVIYWSCMILMPFGSRQKWMRVFNCARRETAQAKFRDLIKQVVHNRIVANASLSWGD